MDKHAQSSEQDRRTAGSKVKRERDDDHGGPSNPKRPNMHADADEEPGEEDAQNLENISLTDRMSRL
jgi:hypothetical protein